MTQRIINLGTGPNTKNGDTVRNAFDKVNKNFTDFYALINGTGVGVYTGNFTTPTSKLGQTQSANPYGGSNTSAIALGQCSLLLNP